MPPAPPIAAAVVPAAGASRRMGRPKLVLPWGGGIVLDATVKALVAGGAARVVVVRGPIGPLAGWQPPAGVEVAVNPHPEEGMLATIRVGLQALAADGVEPDPLLVCPGDLPALSPATVAALIADYRRDPTLLVPTFAGRRGHPLVIPPRWRREIDDLSVDEGLRGILKRGRDEVRHLAVDDPGCDQDVDTPDDYESLRPPAAAPPE